MKTLFLVRHAKSDWSVPGLADFDRPLNQRGYVDAHTMGAHVEKIPRDSTILISSAAIRAMSTAIIFARELNFPVGRILLQPNLYEAEPDAYEETIQSIENKFDTAFVFGHNPTISIVISNLTSTKFNEVPTCAVTSINFKIDDWSRVMETKGTIEKQLFPKTLMS